MQLFYLVKLYLLFYTLFIWCYGGGGEIKKKRGSAMFPNHSRVLKADKNLTLTYRVGKDTASKAAI